VIVIDDASEDDSLRSIAEFTDPNLMPELPPSIQLRYTLMRATVNGGQVRLIHTVGDGRAGQGSQPASL
jgi:hypothetical protein